MVLAGVRDLRAAHSVGAEAEAGISVLRDLGASVTPLCGIGSGGCSSLPVGGGAFLTVVR